MKAADHMGTSTETISRKLILLNMFGFFDKVAERDIPSEILQRAVAVAQRTLLIIIENLTTGRISCLYLHIQQKCLWMLKNLSSRTGKMQYEEAVLRGTDSTDIW